MDKDLVHLRKMIHDANRMVVFTGAGISTESGIPDFRGPNGVWKTNQPIDFRDFVGSEEVRRESWRRKFSGDGSMAAAEPNAGHRAVAELVRVGKVSCVITQNVDGLHQKSGVPDDRIVELHGNASYATCLDCGRRQELEAIRRQFISAGTIPYCEDCGGIVKTATISFGQALPMSAMQRAEAASRECDLFLVAGSSLVVYPAAGYPMLARENGARLVIINNQETAADPYCDLVLHQQIGPTLSAVVD
ncbi:MAG: Sir2 family NAD-dependent protein deacetylase [Proteobacteria bacterium]|jgi:NAD-dependent deacetylase|nr:Sir2 family NAD-dependent protein deacetylase [Pseudomonadota bacterium]MDA1302676.1 Sir2 family NAD-dependent protein deacetylase [Pseudomonadota bacterium]